MSSLLLEAEGLVRRYGGREVLRVDRFTVAPGEIVAVLGPNGAGKSTLFRLLLLLERPDAGHVRVLGVAGADRPAATRRELAGVFQRPHLFAGTVRENVSFGLRARGVTTAAAAGAVAGALESLGLAQVAERRVDTLSGGEAQRVALARAIAVAPAVLLLDEPLAGLDAVTARRLRAELDTVLRSGARGSVIVTHDPADAFVLADRVVVLEDGRVAQAGTPTELLADPATPFIAAFAGAELLLGGVVESLAEGTALVRLAGGVRLHAAVTLEHAGRLRAGVRVQVAYRAEDVVLAPPGDTTLTSERNRLQLRVGGMTHAGGLVRVRLDGDVQLVALVTRGSAELLGLRAGGNVEARLKASALRVFPGG
jgi:molybdate transport system ATP-binding protein